MLLYKKLLLMTFGTTLILTWNFSEGTETYCQDNYPQCQESNPWPPWLKCAGNERGKVIPLSIILFCDLKINSLCGWKISLLHTLLCFLVLCQSFKMGPFHLIVMNQNYVMNIAIFYQTTWHLLPNDGNLHNNTPELW